LGTEWVEGKNFYESRNVKIDVHDEDNGNIFFLAADYLVGSRIEERSSKEAIEGTAPNLLDQKLF